jgi:hypothetical protein
MGENAYILFGKPQEKETIRRSRCRWEDNIKIDLKIIGCGLNSTALGYSSLVSVFEQVLNLGFHKNMKFIDQLSKYKPF